MPIIWRKVNMKNEEVDEEEQYIDSNDLDQVVSFLLLRLRAMEELLVSKKILSKKSIDNKYNKLYEEIESEMANQEEEEFIEDKKLLD
jgi:hypothetical protein